MTQAKGTVHAKRPFVIEYRGVEKSKLPFVVKTTNASSLESAVARATQNLLRETYPGVVFVEIVYHYTRGPKHGFTHCADVYRATKTHRYDQIETIIYARPGKGRE